MKIFDVPSHFPTTTSCGRRTITERTKRSVAFFNDWARWPPKASPLFDVSSDNKFCHLGPERSLFLSKNGLHLLFYLRILYFQVAKYLLRKLPFPGCLKLVSISICAFCTVSSKEELLKSRSASKRTISGNCCQKSNLKEAKLKSNTLSRSVVDFLGELITFCLFLFTENNLRVKVEDKREQGKAELRKQWKGLRGRTFLSPVTETRRKYNSHSLLFGQTNSFLHILCGVGASASLKENTQSEKTPCCSDLKTVR